MTRVDTFVSAVQAKGSDARDARDAAHEACHALKWGVTKKWTRDNIHARKPKVVGVGLSDEILARAVEQLVCADLGVECGSVEKWAGVCFMELIKNERLNVPFEFLKNAITERMEHATAREWADKVLGLAAQP